MPVAWPKLQALVVALKLLLGEMESPGIQDPGDQRDLREELVSMGTLVSKASRGSQVHVVLADG